jgi:hypothetical protein
MRIPGEPRQRIAATVVVIGGLLAFVFYNRLHSEVLDVATISGTLLGVWAVIAAPVTGSASLDEIALDLAHEVEKSWAKKRLVLLGDTDAARLTYVRDRLLERGPRITGMWTRGSLSTISEQFGKLGSQRLVVLGPAGSGKTLVAVELALTLLGQLTSNRDNSPVAIPLSIGGWDGETRLADWLAQRLVIDYRLRTRTAANLVKKGRILPVLDGLDEMGQETEDWKPNAVGALSKLSGSTEMLETTKRGPVILTCLDDFYEEVVGQVGEGEDHALLEAVVIRINRISPRDAARFLASRFRDHPGLNPLSDQAFDAQLHNRESPLARALGNPLILALAVSVLRAGLMSPASLASLDKPDVISSHLLGRFIPAVSSLIPRNVRVKTQIEKLSKGLYDKGTLEAKYYDSDRVQRWLTALAFYLRDNPNPGNELSPIRLWQIAGTTLPRIIHTAISLPMGICVALLAAEFAGGSGGLIVTVMTILLGIRFGVVAGTRLHHKPSRFSARQLFTKKGAWLWVIAAGTGTIGGIAGYLDSGPAAAVSSGTGAALAGVVLAGLNRGISRDVLPWEILNNDLLFGLSLGLAPAVAAGLPTGLNGGLAARLELNTHFTIAGSAGLAITIGILAGIALGSRSWLRHAIAITLMAPTGRLPWRTQRMLEWAYLAGLLRISGISYQFRHEELRKWLTQTQSRS